MTTKGSFDIKVEWEVNELPTGERGHLTYLTFYLPDGTTWTGASSWGGSYLVRFASALRDADLATRLRYYLRDQFEKACEE